MKRSQFSFVDASRPGVHAPWLAAVGLSLAALSAPLPATAPAARAQANAAPLPPGRQPPPNAATTERAPSAGGAVLTVRPNARDGAPAWQAPADNATKASISPSASNGPAAGTSAQAVQGVTDTSVTFAMVSAFTGASRDAGRAMKVGVETAFAQANEAGGVFGRRLKLNAIDDGYEPARTVEGMKKAWTEDKVFGFVGQYGTPTAMVAAPYALEHRALFFGAFTGATVLRRDPPDRYVFNYRPGYAEETEAVVKYLVQVRHIAPEQMMVLAQDDGFGDAGYAGVQKAMRGLRGERATEIPRVNYKRNTLEVGDALKFVTAHRRTLKAVVMVATARAAAKFVERSKDLAPGLVYTDCSGVGSTTLAEELSLLGPKYSEGVIVTQIVPAVEGYSSAILDYKRALEKYAPGEKPDYVSLEGYVVGTLLVNGMKQAGPNLNTETLVDALERLRDVDMGLGTVMSFNRTRHQASDKVWGTVLDAQGHYAPLDLN